VSMPLWRGRHRPPGSRPDGVVPSGSHERYDEHGRVQAIVQLASRLGLQRMGRVSEKGGVWTWREPDLTRCLLYEGPTADRAASLVAIYESAAGQTRADNELSFLRTVVDWVLPAESRASAAEWLVAHPRGGILQLPDVCAVLARRESASETEVGLTFEFADGRSDHLRSGRLHL
jgi:hypothetical protein